MLRALFTALLVLVMGNHAHAGKRVSLVVGNSAYKHAGELPNPKNDAVDMAAALRKASFHVIEALDLDKASFDRRIREFATALAGAEAGLFFYAGHGLQVAGKNYLVPIDAELAAAEALEFETVQLDTIHRIMERQTNTNIIFLDACRNNPLSRNLARAMGTRSADIGRGLAVVESGVGTLISFSTQPGNVALDGTGRNSPFAGSLVKRIASSSDDLSAILIHVRNDVRKETENKQVPWEHSALTGQFYFGAPPQAHPTTTPPTVQPSGGEIAQVCQAIANNPSLAVVQSLLESYKGTPMAACAQARVDELKKQQLAVIAPPAEKPPPPQPPSLKPAISVTPQLEPQPQPTLRGDLKLAAAGPFSGSVAALGIQLKQGAEFAVADINASGGILGQKVTFVWVDDRADPKEGVSVANRLAAEGARFVIGHFLSGVTIPASDVYQTGGILMITPSATNPRITERNLWNVFRTVGRDDQQATISGNIIADRYMGKRVALVHDKTVYGQGLAEKVRAVMNAKGLSEVYFGGVNREDKDFTALVSTLKSQNVGLVHWSGLHDTGGLILRQMRSGGVRATFMAGDGIAAPEFVQFAGPAAEGTLMTLQPSPAKDAANRSYVESFRKRYGTQPEGYTLYSYAAVQVIKQAAEAAKSVDPRKVADVMHSGKIFKTVLGDISFDMKGDVSPGYPVSGAKKGTYVLYVWRKGSDGKLAYFEE